MTEKIAPKFTIIEKDGSLWVNGEVNCLGRFTPKNWEIFQELRTPSDGIHNPTLEVSMKPTDEKSWKNFVTQMKSFHNIDLSSQEYPGKGK